MLNLASYDIFLQEVPGEISLGLSFSGCPSRCPGCHSSELQNPELGSTFGPNELNQLLSTYSLASCVLFFGGDWDVDSLQELMYVAKQHDKKLCLYSGLNKIHEPFVPLLDYLKLGSYIERLGPLNSPTTNQRLYKKEENNWTDITCIFRREIGGNIKQETNLREN